RHRRRTTPAQKKVLEGIFTRDTRPDAARRKALATELNMTPRSIQAWFQYRREKEKWKASKLGLGESDDVTLQLMRTGGLALHFFS
ncbi:hypothetical protein FB451DRAFT_1036088, partial [Mycena latifolia]